MPVETYRCWKSLILITILLGTSAMSASAQRPFENLGKPHNFAAEDAKPQAVWLPYWSERDHHHATLHVRNVMLHTPIDITVELFAAAGSRGGGHPTTTTRGISGEVYSQFFLVPRLFDTNFQRRMNGILWPEDCVNRESLQGRPRCYSNSVNTPIQIISLIPKGEL